MPSSTQLLVEYLLREDAPVEMPERILSFDEVIALYDELRKSLEEDKLGLHNREEYKNKLGMEWVPYITKVGLSGNKNYSITIPGQETMWTADLEKDAWQDFVTNIRTWYYRRYLKTKQMQQKAKQEIGFMPTGPFGKFFAGQERRLPDYTAPEKNTDEEERLYFKIKDHIFDTDSAISTQVAKEIQDILKSGLYTDIFKKPNVRFVIRGMFLEPMEFYYMFKEVLDDETKNSIRNGTTTKGTINKPTRFRPFRNRGASSWTKSEEKATDFTRGSINKDHFRILLFARVTDNPHAFFDLEDFYSINIDMNSYEDEKEVIGLGEIGVAYFEWQRIGRK